MKKIIHFLFLMIIFSSCKKSSTSIIPPGNPNNQVNAMVSVKGEASAPLTAAGNFTLFAKRTDPNGDVVIVCAGSGVQGKATVTLVNISSAGSYTIGGGGPAGSQYIMGTFEIGSPITGPTYQLFLVPSPPPISGTITIDELTSNSIRGSFAMTCSGTTGIVQITNGTFKGSF